MKISESWLREWVNPPLHSDALQHQLTMAGLEVEGVETAAPPFTQVVAGRVIALQPHPNAEKLRVATVDVGTAEPLTIVCGAPNVAVDLTVPVALVGATLPNNVVIHAAELRGVPSAGMLCSAQELGLSDKSDGLLPLPPDTPVGADVRRQFALDDAIIEIKFTPNRGDCLSLWGVAREVAALNDLPLTPPDAAPVAATVADTFPVRLDAPAACPRFVARVMRGVDVARPTPLWMTEKLRRAGIRSINAVVDVTNFVMLELGQPMHAYDLAALHGGITVRFGRDGDALRLLNGQNIAPKADELVIADAQQVLGLAGIMGGEGSGVSVDSKDIFLECAYFDPLHIAGRARRYGLHTDASHRFERGVDFNLCVVAAERATGLILALCGGEAGPLVDHQAPDSLPTRPPVVLRRTRLAQYLGLTVADDEVAAALTRLGMGVATTADGWTVTPPSWRFDVVIEVDLIEEIARLVGYDQLPTRSRLSGVAPPSPTECRRGVDDLRQILVQRDYSEVVTFSFVDELSQRAMAPTASLLTLANPIASDLAVMRQNLWPGLLKVAHHNRQRQQMRLRLFEVGNVFLGGDAATVQQVSRVGGLLMGTVAAEQWALDDRKMDFYDLKADVQALLPPQVEFAFTRDAHPALHPGQSAALRRGGEIVGYLGAIHPRVAKQFDFESPIFLFEINVLALTDGRLPQYAPLSRFPTSRRDLALVMPESLAADMVRTAIVEAAGPLLRDCFLFDVYRGKGLAEGEKSLAFALLLQDFAGNLTDQAVDAVVSQVVTALAQSLGCRLR